jgi:hypothetical protein
VARKLAIRAAALGMAGAGLLTGAGQAQAASANISSWDTYSAPVRCTSTQITVYYCLYYSQGANGAVWRGIETSTPTISGIFYDDGQGSAGVGQGVRNNAASAENASLNCNVGIWVFPYYQGDSNWLSPGRGGNLSANLRNNEASIAACR